MQKWVQQKLGVDKVFSVSNYIHKILGQSPDADTLAAGAAKKGVAAWKQLTAFWRLTAGKFFPQDIVLMDWFQTTVLGGKEITEEPASITAWVAKTYNEFSDLGIDNAKIQSALIALAIAGASAEGFTGRAATDKKIKLMIKQLGAEDKVDRPLVLQSIINAFAGRAEQNIQNRMGMTFRMPGSKARLKRLWKPAWTPNQAQKSALLRMRITPWKVQINEVSVSD
jgi:hypothetical protein